MTTLKHSVITDSVPQARPGMAARTSSREQHWPGSHWPLLFSALQLTEIGLRMKKQDYLHLENPETFFKPRSDTETTWLKKKINQHCEKAATQVVSNSPAETTSNGGNAHHEVKFSQNTQVIRIKTDTSTAL